MKKSELVQAITVASESLTKAAEIYYHLRAEELQAENNQAVRYWDAINDGEVGGKNQQERDATFWAIARPTVEDSMRKAEATFRARVAWEKAKQEWKLWTYITGIEGEGIEVDED